MLAYLARVGETLYYSPRDLAPYVITSDICLWCGRAAQSQSKFEEINCETKREGNEGDVKEELDGRG